MANREELEQKNVDELRELAREREVEGRSSMNKEDLVNALADDSSSGSDNQSDAEQLLTPTGPDRGDEQSEAEAKLSQGNPTPGESADGEGQRFAEEHDEAAEIESRGGNPDEASVSHHLPASDPKNPEVQENLSPSGQEALEKIGEDSAYATESDLALDASGPLHLQSPEERVMTGAVNEDHAEEQNKALANKPEDYVGNVTEAGFDEDGNLITRQRQTAPVVEVVDEEAADTVGKESRGERRERQGIDPNAGESLRELSDNAEAIRSGDRSREDSTPEGESSSEGNEVSDTGGDEERNQPVSNPDEARGSSNDE